MIRFRTIGIGVLLAASVATLYVTRLEFAPVYLMHDESKFALQAESIASTGRDMSGRRFPLYFYEWEFPPGRDPVVIYATALVLKALPLSDTSVRLGTAVVGVLNVVLMFLVARRIFKSDVLGLIAAILLALTPVHFIRSRLALSPHYSIPFILAWLLWLTRYCEAPRRRTLAVSIAWLAVGCYTYLACMVMMPVYVLLTAAVAFRRGPAGWTRVLAVAFLVPLIPMAAWFVTHPERYGQIVAAYQLYSSDANAIEGAAGLAAYDSIRLRVGLFWSFFSPEFLFISGDSSLINSTRQVGFFPLVFALLIPLGIYRIVKSGDDIAKVILVGLISAPLASVISGAIEVNRTMFAVPFGVLTAAYGAAALLETRTVWLRGFAIVVLLTVPLQFAGFYRDYMGRYRADSSFWFGGNLRDAFKEVIRTEGRDGRLVYVSRAIPFHERYWPFYAVAADRRDLVDRAVFYDPQTLDAAAVTKGARLVCDTRLGGCEPQGRSGLWTLLMTATEPDGTPSFAVYEKR